jgi:gamma-glutamylputrescine oxidase
MTSILPRPKSTGASPNGAPGAERGADRRRILDCEVVVVGSDLAALALAHRLAGAGREVVRLAVPADPALPLDDLLAPGFAMPARALVHRIGEDDAGALWALSREAAAQGRDLAKAVGVPLGPKGALLAARPHAAGRLADEQELLAHIAPGTARLVAGADLERLIGSGSFVAALGLVPAVRIPAGALAAALARAAASVGIQEIAADGAVACDLKGLRKYVDLPNLRIRAFEVILCGTAILRAGAPHLAAGLKATHFAAGRVPLAGAPPAYGGRVREYGGLGIDYHADESGLVLAVETALPVRTAAGAARILSRTARGLLPDGPAGRPEGRGYRILSAPHGMPVAGRIDKGVHVIAGLGLQPVSAHLLTAALVAEAIGGRDDRLALLQPFLALEPRGTLAALADMAAVWRAQLSVRAAPRAEARGGEAQPEAVPAAVAPRPAPPAGRPRGRSATPPGYRAGGVDPAER